MDQEASQDPTDYQAATAPMAGMDVLVLLGAPVLAALLDLEALLGCQANTLMMFPHTFAPA